MKQKLQKALKDLACPDGELSILFTDDKHIAELNSQYLGKKGPTNVLAFPMLDSGPPSAGYEMLGDIVVSVDTALRESRDLGEPLEETLYRLLIHGLLHLLNYDHDRSSKEARRMEKEERRILALIMEGC